MCRHRFSRKLASESISEGEVDKQGREDVGLGQG